MICSTLELKTKPPISATVPDMHVFLDNLHDPKKLAATNLGWCTSSEHTSFGELCFRTDDCAQVSKNTPPFRLTRDVEKDLSIHSHENVKECLQDTC